MPEKIIENANKRNTFAAGKFQLTPNTSGATISKLKLDTSTPVYEKMQG